MVQQILEKIKEFDTIIIHRHKRPDGDCIGSQFGLKYFIEENFKEKKVYAVGDDVPKHLKFNGLSEEISDDIYKDALVIVVDTSVTDRICDNRYMNGKFLIKIDHHDDTESFGDIQYVDPTSPACSQIITLMINEWNLPIPKKAARALYTGIVTDTGRFQFRGVGSKTFSAAGILTDTGIDITHIYNQLNLKDINSKRLEAYLYKHMKTTPNGVLYMYFSKRIMKKFNVSCEDAAALVSCLSTMRNHPFWITFVEYPENIRVRLRSRTISINEIGRKYHGGGHLQASGATVYSKKEMKKLLVDADLLLKKAKLEIEGLE